jgi:hypothetical protein
VVRPGRRVPATLELSDDVLDRIDEIVPPGTDVYAPNASFDVPWLSDPAQRRRRGARAAALDPELTLA